MGSEDNNPMNGAQIHLFLVHLPVAGFLFSAVMVILGRVTKNESFLRWTRTGVVVFGALAAITYLTGEGAEEFLASIDLADKARIEAHESVALISMLLGLTAGAVQAFLLWRKKFKKAFWAADALVIVAALSFQWTAHKGGLIRHHELEISGPEAARVRNEKSLDSGFLNSESQPGGGPDSHQDSYGDVPATTPAESPPQNELSPHESNEANSGPQEFGTSDGSQKLKIRDDLNSDSNGDSIQDIPNVDQEPNDAENTN